jgi:hypothetical protein
MSITDIVIDNRNGEISVKSGEKLALTICSLTPLALVRYGHNFVKHDRPIRRKIGRKTSPENMLFDPTRVCPLRT